MADRSTFGKYVLLRKLATGGMGEVFLAKQVGPSGFEKLLVIKRILAQHHDKHEYLNMFLSEARLVAYLTHSNIIQIHEMGQIDGDYFIAMEYVRGRSLRDVIDSLRTSGRTLPLPYVIDLAIKLCDGLGYAHEARDIRGRPMNIIHRDINPHNVLVSYGGDLKIIDFGIAKSEMTDVHTATGTIKGKFVYMSPEQSAADPIDKRSDIFSLGIVLYEMATGENPFVRQNVVLSLEAIQRHNVPVPSTKRADATALDAVLMKALEKKPEDRFQNAYEMRDELRNLMRGGLVRPMDNDLSGFLHDLFKADIEEEDRLLAEADRATSPPRPSIAPPAPEPRLPANLPSMPAFSQPPHASVGPGGPSDPDTKADRPMRTPQPIRAAAFSDDEPTQATDIGEMAARSRAQSMVSKAGGPREPTGQVFTLIAADDIAPGTNEEYAGSIPPPASDGPHTKRERIPIAASTQETGADQVQSSEDLPAAALSEPLPGVMVRSRGTSAPPPPPRPSIPILASAISTVSALESANNLDESGDIALSVPPIASGSAPPMSLPPPSGDLASMRGEISRSNGALSLRTPPRPVPSAPSNSMAPASHGHEPALRDVRDDSSASLPVYTGTNRRSTLVAGALVFALAAVAGFWGVRSLMGMWGGQPEETAIPADLVDPMPSSTPTDFAPVEPARDPGVSATPVDVRPTPSPSPVLTPPPSPLATATPRPSASPTPSPTPIATASPSPTRRPRESKEPKERRPREAKATPTPKPTEEPKPIASAEPKATPTPKPTPTPKSTPEPVPSPTKEPKEPRETPKPGGTARLGIVTLSASSEVTVEHEGRPAGSSPSSMMIKGESGTITLSGADVPFTVKLTYKVVDGELSVKIDSNPWSIVKHNGISLGKTPQEPEAGKRHKFSLLRPGQAAPLDVSLLWNPTTK